MSKRVDFNPLNVRLIKDGHYYKDKEKNRYESVTTVLKRFTPDFDPDGKITERIAEQNGLTTEEQRILWRAKGIEAARLGTNVHEFIELHLKGFSREEIMAAPGVSCAHDCYEEAVRLFNKWLSREAIESGRYHYYPEQIVADPELRIAGTIDMLIQSGDKFAIVDWKTNKKIDRQPYDPEDKLYAPFQYFDDCHLDKYRLQIAMYAAIIELNLGIEIKNAYIGHIPSIIEIPGNQIRSEVINVYDEGDFRYVKNQLLQWRKAGDIPKGPKVDKPVSLSPKPMFPGVELTKTNIGKIADQFVLPVIDGEKSGLQIFVGAKFGQKVMQAIMDGTKAAYLRERETLTGDEAKIFGERPYPSKDYSHDKTYALLDSIKASWKSILDCQEEPEYRKPYELEDLVEELRQHIQQECYINPPEEKVSYSPVIRFPK